MTTPSSGITGATLARDKIDRYRSTGAFGKPAYQSHVQLRAMLKAKRGERFANYFARPTVDPDLGELRWTAEVPGKAIAWRDLPEADRAQHALTLQVIHAGLISFVQELRAQGGDQPGGAGAFASLLEQAMKVPDQDSCVHFVDKQPVLAFWGFENHDGSSVDPANVAPRYAAAATVAAPPLAAVPAEPVVVPPVETPVLVEVRRKRPWWWWLLWALLALLLLLLLLFGPRACTPEGGIDLRRMLPGHVEPPDGGASRPEVQLNPDGTPVPGGRVPGVNGSEGSASAPDIAVPAIDGASVPGGGAVIPPDLSASGADAGNRPDVPPDAPPKDDPNKTPPTPDADKQNQDNPAKPDDPTQPDKQDKNQPPSTNPPLPVDPKAMNMPDPQTAKKMQFLEGDWKAGEGLVDKETKQPMDLSFKFGKDGKGEMTLRRPDGTRCTGSVSGSMSGGHLGIQGSQSIPCSDGRPYAPPKIDCAKDSGGTTQCYGINPDGSRYYMGMQRQ